MNVFIIDNVLETRKHLSKLLRLFCQNVNIIGCSESLKDGIEQIKSSDPDLIFLNTDLFDNQDQALFVEFSKGKFHTVILTSINNLTTSLIGMNAFDSLMIPIEPDALVKCVKKAHWKLKEQFYPNHSHLINEPRKTKLDRIGIPTSKGIKYISLEKIIYLKSHDNYTEIFQEEGKSILISKALKSFEKTLSETFFSRVHQSYLVNLEKVVELQRIDGWFLILKNNHKVPVSRAKKTFIKSRLEQTWRMV